MVYVLDGGGPKDSENTLNSFLTKNKEKVFWQIGADMVTCILVNITLSCIYETDANLYFLFTNKDGKETLIRCLRSDFARRASWQWQSFPQRCDFGGRAIVDP